MRTFAGLMGGLVLAGFAMAPAMAAPVPAPLGALAGTTVEPVVTDHHRHLRYSGRTDKAYRAHRRMNTHMHGNPNARNPERMGYGQQLGNTTNGPRY